MTLKIGLDIDGVLSRGEKVTSVKEARRAIPTYLSIPESQEIYLVSARPRELREATEEWLEKFKIPYKRLYLIEDNNLFDDKTREEKDLIQGKFKASKIEELDLEIFVEDRLRVRNYLRRNTDCLIMNREEARGLFYYLR